MDSDADTTDPSHQGSMYGFSFEQVREEARLAAADPGWQEELRIIRDESRLLLVQFLRVRESHS